MQSYGARKKGTWIRDLGKETGSTLKKQIQIRPMHCSSHIARGWPAGALAGAGAGSGSRGRRGGRGAAHGGRSASGGRRRLAAAGVDLAFAGDEERGGRRRTWLRAATGRGGGEGGMDGILKAEPMARTVRAVSAFTH